jgi:hypothetical protein
MIFKTLLQHESALDSLTEEVVESSVQIVREHYANDVLEPLTTILNGSGTAEEKQKEIATTFKPLGGTIGVAALVSAMLVFLTVPTSPKEFVQLYLALGATQNKVKQYFANSQYKPHFTQDEVDYVVNDWMKINQRFIKAGIKVNSIPGFSIKSKDGKAYTGYEGVKYVLTNLDSFEPSEINSFLGALKKIKTTVDSKFKTKFRDLAKDDGSGLV